MRPLEDSALRILYRGRLASCNYDCSYCPFAKRRDSRDALTKDAQDLARFVAWVRDASEPLGILFTPWGEGLVRKHYIESLIELSHMKHVRRVAIQTNLSSNLRWLKRANADSLALWCTYHPSQVTRVTFLRRIKLLREHGIRFSVGIVGAREHFAEIEAVREQLQRNEYLWINALSPRAENYYSSADIERLTSIDPHFPFNLSPPPSLGAACRAGDGTISVNGDGEVRPCHFVQKSLGNIYDGSFAAQRRRMTCPNSQCSCFIGYMHRTDLPVAGQFGDGVLERFWSTSMATS